MTTTQARPNLAPKDRRAKKDAEDAALDEGVRITLDGETYELRVGDVSSSLTRELRAKAGMSFNRLLEYVTEDPDSDVIAAFIWLARRIRGEKVEFDDVTVTYKQLLGDDFDIVAPGDPEVGDDGPEA